MADFEAIINEYGNSLARLTQAYEADRALQEDLFQEILIALHGAMPSLREKDRTAPYIFRIAHNRAATHVARRVRYKQEEGASTTQAGEGADPERALLASERVSRLTLAIRRLPLPYRQVMTLLLEEMTYAEIAETLQISPSNVGVRISRAKGQLKELLDE